MLIKTAVIGLGYWGPNYLRNFIRHPSIDPIWGCDLSQKALNKIHKLYPKIKLTTNYNNLLSDKSLDMIAIATPPITHFKLAETALQNLKHVLIAKPMVTDTLDANRLLSLAKNKNLLLHCDLTYLYSGGIRIIKDLVSKHSFGTPLYYDSVRINLGLVQNDVNVIWDLAIHDFSILSYLFNLKPIKIISMGSKHHENSKTEEMAHITLKYTNNFTAHIHVSWLAPVKLRTILIGGTKKMIFFDDIQPDEKVKIYNRGIVIPPDTITPFKPAYRSGNIIIPKLDQEEPLYLEIDDIVTQLRKREISYENAKLSMKTIRLLEACDESLKTNKEVFIK